MTSSHSDIKFHLNKCIMYSYVFAYTIPLNYLDIFKFNAYMIIKKFVSLRTRTSSLEYLYEFIIGNDWNFPRIHFVPSKGYAQGPLWQTIKIYLINYATITIINFTQKIAR